MTNRPLATEKHGWPQGVWEQQNLKFQASHEGGSGPPCCRTEALGRIQTVREREELAKVGGGAGALKEATVSLGAATSLHGGAYANIIMTYGNSPS